jgi:hypothetical protein
MTSSDVIEFLFIAVIGLPIVRAFSLVCRVYCINLRIAYSDTHTHTRARARARARIHVQ